MIRYIFTIVSLTVLVTHLLASRCVAQNDWPQFRGPQASGVGNGNPPIEWNVETGQNILWKIKIDGLAHSAPIVFGDRVFLTNAVTEQGRDVETPTGFLGGTGESADDSGAWQWQVICFDLKTGKEIWKTTVAQGVPKIKRHIKASHANCTPATDGKHVVAFFGSEGLFCLDMNGDMLWQKDLGKLHSGPYDAPKLEWGFASSPIICDDKVIVQCDCLNTGFVAIFEINDGHEIRRIERKDVATWSSPAILKTDTETQLICNGYKQMAGYNLDTGEELWTLHGGGDVPVPTPLLADGLIFITNGHGRSPTYAISPKARGDITPDEDAERLPEGLIWWQPRGGSYIPTPIIVGDCLYTCSDRGVLRVRNANTGESVYQQRAGENSGTYSASAIGTEKQIYFFNENGVVSVVKTGPEYQLLATNEMTEPVLATPALIGDRLLVRTTRHLFCIGRTPEK